MQMGKQEESYLENKRSVLLSELKRISSFKLLPDEMNRLDICMFSGGIVGRFVFQIGRAHV